MVKGIENIKALKLIIMAQKMDVFQCQVSMSVESKMKEVINGIGLFVAAKSYGAYNINLGSLKLNE
jgi:hypothetical protein